MSLVHKLSGWALRHLSPSQFDSLRSAYLGLRRRLAPLMNAWHGTFDAQELIDHLKSKFGNRFEILMVHCSVNNLQPMFKGEALDLLKALRAYAEPAGTLAMPAFYFGEEEDGGAYATLARLRRIELRRIPSQMGLLSELFRRSRGVASSRHPIMRVSAAGPLAADLVRGHESAELPCGRGSPFDFMTSHDTLIIGIGKPIEVLTHVHHVEDVMIDEFPVPSGRGEPLDLVLVDGKEEVPFTLKSRGLKWRRDMMRLRQFMPPSQLQEWTFHGVPMFAVRAAEVTAALRKAAQEGHSIYIES